MRKMLLFGLMILLLSSCGTGTFQVPKQDYQAKVQVLGVVPLLLDRQAPLDYPQREALYDLLVRSNAGKHEQLVTRLKAKKGYFDVRSLSGSADLLEMSLLAGERPRDEVGRPTGYLFNPEAVDELARRNVVDALLVVIFTGGKVEETRRSRNLLESLNTGYNDVLVTAAVIDRQGQPLWTMAGKDSFQAMTLQYADFDEAYYNRTDQVEVKNIRLSGIEPLLMPAPESAEQATVPKLYERLFDQIAAGISPGLLGSL